MPGKTPWWQGGTIYQIYPLSFMDSDGDGRGDLAGITRRLDYLERLGVSALWLSPIYPSPMADYGYDVSDYRGIHPVFGTMADFDRLLHEVHARGLKLILDFVPNHTSVEHPWFRESRSSRDNPRRDWYFWRDPAPDGGPPNNWLASFGGSGWERDDRTGQYYYHAFLKEQPDLDWRNPRVREAMLDVMRFWLDKGVDGFRVDVMWHLVKDARFRDNPPNPSWREGDPEYQRLVPAYSANQPEVHDAVAAMRRVIDGYDERVLLGEIYLPVSELVGYYGKEASGAQLPLNFELIQLPWQAKDIYAGVSGYLGSVPGFGWPNWVLGNHDKPRVASRVGREQARVAALLFLTLRGTPVLYYGDELGMVDVPIPRGLLRDPADRNRDPQRTPMQWSPGPAAGFTAGTPWLPVSDDYRSFNVESEQEDPRSFLSFYRRLLGLRRREAALSLGGFAPVGIQGDVIAYLREEEGSRAGRGPGSRFLVVLNLSHRARIFTLPEGLPRGGRVVFGTHAERRGDETGAELQLSADEGIVIRL